MKNLSLNLKVSFVIGVLIAASVLIAGMGLYQMKRMNDSLDDIADVRVKSLSEARNIRELFYLQIINERNFLLYVSPEGKAEIAESIVKRDKEIRQLISERQRLVQGEARDSLEKFLSVYDSWHEIHKEIVGLERSGKEKEAREIVLTKGRQLRIAGQETSEKMVNLDLRLMNAKRVEAEATFTQANTLTWIISLSSILIGVSLAVFIFRAVNKSIHSVIQQLEDNSELVTRTSRQIAAASEELSSASTEQASSLEETVATLEEITSMVSVNSSNAKEAAKLATDMRAVASKGETSIRNLVSSMVVISNDSKKIEDITSVVDDLAFQTNLLALNAAVEAARAGEQGKSFAVVADAVRNLAHRSSSAAKEIKELIRESVEKIEIGSQQAVESGQVLEEIVASIKKVSDLNTEIASASEEQTNGIQQINKAMNQLDQVSQVNAATSEQTAASAQELSGQSERLNEAVHVLVVTIDGSDRSSTANITPPSLKKALIDLESSKAA